MDCILLRSIVLLLAPGLTSLLATEPEDELKAATVLTFIRHAEWRRGGAGAIQIGVIGRAAMVRTLRRTLEGKTANTRVIRVTEGKSAAELQGCQVIYLAADSSKDVVPSLTALRGTHALTIGESDHFLEYGGAVNLLIVDGRMSFEVSREALERAGVNISATLLRYGQVTSTGSRAARPPA